jgi:large subunit ribosomal protein L23
MKTAYSIIVKPHITEKSVALSYGDPNIVDESQIQRKYTFIVAKDANKIEIRKAFEDIYNAGKKGDEVLKVVSVRTAIMPGKRGRRMGSARQPGHQPDRKKAVITLAKGQMLEDYGV